MLTMWQGGTDALFLIGTVHLNLGFCGSSSLVITYFFQMKESFGKKPPEDDPVLAICGPEVSI